MKTDMANQHAALQATFNIDRALVRDLMRGITTHGPRGQCRGNAIVASVVALICPRTGHALDRLAISDSKFRSTLHRVAIIDAAGQFRSFMIGFRPRAGRRQATLEQRFHCWIHRHLVAGTESKVSEADLRRKTGPARGTSRQAFDESGEVHRDAKETPAFAQSQRSNAITPISMPRITSRHGVFCSIADAARWVTRMAVSIFRYK